MLFLPWYTLIKKKKNLKVKKKNLTVSKIFRGEKTNTDPVPAYILNFQAENINSQVKGKCLHFQWVVCTTTSPFTGDTGSKNESFTEVKFFCPYCSTDISQHAVAWHRPSPNLKKWPFVPAFCYFSNYLCLDSNVLVTVSSLGETKVKQEGLTRQDPPFWHCPRQSLISAIKLAWLEDKNICTLDREFRSL